MSLISKFRRSPCGALTLVLLATLTAACGGSDAESTGEGSGTAAAASSGDKITIGYQPGIGYAQLLIMKQEGWLQEALDGRQVEYRSLTSGADIRDGMISGDIQIGAGGIGPFLVGYDKGVKWKLLSALEDSDIWLMAKDPRLTNLEAFGPGDKIALPGPDSIQAVVVKRAAQEQLGDPAKLDANMVKLAHPEALQSLLSGQVAAHMTSPPFQFQEQDQGARKLLGSADVFGQHTFNSVFVREEYQAENKDVTDAVYAQVERATKLINDDPKAAAAILEKESGGQLKAADAERYLTDPSTTYTTEPHGFMAFATFMQDIGLIENAPSTWQDLVFDNLKGLKGS